MSASPSMMKTSALHDSAVKLPRPRDIATPVRSGHSIEYRITYALVFMVCLSITGLCRLLTLNRYRCMDDASASLWSEARSAADSTVPYVFQQ